MASEGDSVEFVLDLGSTTIDTVSFRYTILSETAKIDVDLPALSNQIFKIAPERLSDTLKVATTEDNINESNETFKIVLTSLKNAVFQNNTAVGTIQDDDPSPVLSVDDASFNEGQTGNTPFVFQVLLDKRDASPVWVSYILTDSTAKVDDLDYRSRSGVLEFKPGETVKLLTFDVHGDRTWEPSEFLKLELSNPVGASLPDNLAVGTIINDDSLPVLSVSDVKIDEGNAGIKDMRFVVTLDRPSAEDVSFKYETVKVGKASPRTGLYKSRCHARYYFRRCYQ